MSEKMTPEKSCNELAGILQRATEEGSTLHRQLARTTVQALCFAIGYMFPHNEAENEPAPQAPTTTTQPSHQRSKRG